MGAVTDYPNHMSRSSAPAALFIVLVILLAPAVRAAPGTGGDSEALKPIDDIPAPDTSLHRSPDGIVWRVANAFRLIKPPELDQHPGCGDAGAPGRHGQQGAPRDNTADQIERYWYYLTNGVERPCHQRTELPHDTWWRWNEHDYDRKYEISPKSLWVELAAPSSLRGSCQWSNDGVLLSQRNGPSSCDETVVASCSTEKGCVVSVRSLAAGEPDKPVELPIKPRNIVVATLGDSYASGEGVPDARASRLTPLITRHNARWIDKRCHRSLFSGHAVSGLLYTLLNPHVAVTYVSYACSGALLSNGLLLPYKGQDPSDPKHPLDPQMDKLRKILNGRQADFLTLSFGGNDVGFGDIVMASIFKNDERFNELVPELISAGLAKLTKAADTAAAAEHQQPLSRNLAVVEYPNPTVLVGLPRGADMSTILALREHSNECAGGSATVTFIPLIFAKVFGLFGWGFDVDKVKVVAQKASDALTKFGKDFAGKMGAFPIANSPAGEFSHHGFCAPGLTNSSDKRWINTVRDSFRTQGTGVIFGAMHPNVRGQGKFARELVAWIEDVECREHRSTESRGDDKALWESICDREDWKENRLFVQPPEPGALPEQAPTNGPR
jgi:hypothetical protein